MKMSRRFMLTLIFLMRKWKNLQNKRIILGVDPGLRATGYGVLELSYDPEYHVKL